MAVHVAGPEDPNPFNWRRGSGVRPGVPTPFGFELTVIPVDVDDAVRSAGGWLCDRVRAGWKVNMFVDEAADIRPLEILGIRSFSSDDKFEALKGAPPAALAVAADVVAQDIQLLKFIDRVVEGKAIEFTLWGEYVPVGLEGRLQRVRNQMSPTAAAFKKYAVGACSITCPVDEPVEQFHSSGLWYPTDGTDLVPST
jgi:hypothetical protein